MITVEGKQHIRRYMAGYVPALALAVAWGIGQNAENANDISLGLEVGRAKADFIDFDFDNDAIIYKAPIPEEFAGIISEIAIFSELDDSSSGSYASKIISTFDEDTEAWNNGTYTTANTRIGANSLNLAPAANGTLTASLSSLNLDFSGNSGADQFLLAFTNNNANASSVTLRFKTDASNYYTFTTATPATGWQVSAFNKSAATVTGTPNWGLITSVEVGVSSTSGGASSVDFEAIRLEDRDTTNQDFVMVARKVITPITKIGGQSADAEYSLDVTIP